MVVPATAPTARLPRPTLPAAIGLAAGTAALAAAMVAALELARMPAALPATQPETASAAGGGGGPSAEAAAGAALARWRGELASWHLLGTPPAAAGAGAAPAPEPEPEPEPAVLSAEALPDSESGLRLTGIVATGRGEAGRAVIAAERGSEQEYAVGDTLPGGARLQAVDTYSVVIRRDGQLEALRLPRFDPSTGSGPQARNDYARQRGAGRRRGGPADSLAARMRGQAD